MGRFGLWMLMVGVLAGCASAPPPTVQAVFLGQEGALQFLITPADAKVFVDADYKGLVRDFQGDNVLNLHRGLHAVEVIRDGYLTFFRQVQITQGLLEVMILTMQVNTE